ncbi:hypothetical protein GC089_16920 [Cellulomonas sp. JZ18]|uniref:hypothetical protein n=1 Tax=Cellulomonas sp. JZ18 TaxID=2654191 RepID=UPI0012D3781E|nr:hypothetical protein [Cellulomonas sp. JZ18]QGQ20561.1 hypothetical protein GC089_16920 [Cellulomonas sp. JZ18]
MRRAGVVVVLAGGLLLTGCAGGEPDAVPSTVSTEPSEDQVRADAFEERLDGLEGRLQDADEGVREQAGAALDEARGAVDEAVSLRDRGTEEGRTAAAERLEAAVDELEATAEGAPDGYAEELDRLTGELRTLAESLRAPEDDDR